MARRPSNEPLYSMMQPKRAAVPPPEDRATSDDSYDWITCDERFVHQRLVPVIKRLVSLHAPRLWRSNMMESMYCNEDVNRIMIDSGVRLAKAEEKGAAKNMPAQTENLIKAYTDTLVGKLLQSNSRVQALTSGGEWNLFKLARKFSFLFDSTRQNGGYNLVIPRVAHDAVTVGIGHVKVDDSGDYVKYERKHYNELFVDPYDAARGNPSMLFSLHYEKRERLLAQYGHDEDCRKRILTAPSAIQPTFAWTPYDSGMIAVFEAWAIPQENREGRHVLCLETGVLDEDLAWASKRFPFITFRASDLPLGWYGQGFTPFAAGAQLMLNGNLTMLAKAVKLGVAPYWVVAGNATVSVKQLTNAEGRIVTSTGAAPQWVTNQPFHPMSINYNDSLRMGIRAVYGISDIEALGASPQSRYDSDPALVRLQDAWTIRHMQMLGNWSEGFHLELAEATVEAAQRIAKRQGTYPVLSERHGRSEMLDWKDFKEFEQGRYKLNLAAESPLPLSKAGRAQEILNWKSQGLISGEEALSMIQGSADLQSLTSRITAYENNADHVVDELMEGKTPHISKMQKYDIVLNKVRAGGLQAIENGAPDKVIQNFESYTGRLTAAVQQEMMETQAMMSAQTGGVPNGGPASGSGAPGA